MVFTEGRPYTRTAAYKGQPYYIARQTAAVFVRISEKAPDRQSCPVSEGTADERARQRLETGRALR